MYFALPDRVQFPFFRWPDRLSLPCFGWWSSSQMTIVAGNVNTINSHERYLACFSSKSRSLSGLAAPPGLGPPKVSPVFERQTNQFFTKRTSSLRSFCLWKDDENSFFSKQQEDHDDWSNPPVLRRYSCHRLALLPQTFTIGNCFSQPTNITSQSRCLPLPTASSWIVSSLHLPSLIAGGSYTYSRYPVPCLGSYSQRSVGVTILYADRRSGLASVADKAKRGWKRWWRLHLL